MKIEKLNEIMNCECLQSIIEHDKKTHTIENEILGGYKIIQTPYDDCSRIILECLTSYRSIGINFNTGRKEQDIPEHDHSTLPILYCPICGCKTKHNIPTESFYSQFQK